ncbi:MAG TPA: enoyl-CoA hydratase-related protein [Candidatus Thermoplasmatota archaeon]|nr:enoyl-CoA hydratase-related protein [Candidatus Thermoplasmatota archaeon]
MQYPTLLVDVKDGIAFLTLNRPDKRNALNAEARKDLMACLNAMRDDGAVRVVVVTGGGKAFAAGADIDEMAARSLWEQRQFITPPHIYDAVSKYPKPVIAAINGFALGAGCELAMACDYRLAAAGAKLGQPEINLGIIPGGGGTQRLPRLVGTGRAARLLFTGELIDAETAERWGLVDEVVAPEGLLGRAEELARKMAEKSPLALKLAKEALRAAEELPLRESLAREIDLFSMAFASEDKREGIAAFKENRKPVWTGR